MTFVVSLSQAADGRGVSGALVGEDSTLVRFGLVHAGRGERALRGMMHPQVKRETLAASTH